ncbi:hypothetical protein [Arthrobacter sp. KK5.5]|uniref:hypothetical protein n=1 Tax=Arthrobacter sp. KK5.5 TaxID=3373084 RepID=UPI003EE588B3
MAHERQEPAWTASEPMDDGDAQALSDGVIDFEDARPAAGSAADDPAGVDSERRVVLQDRRDGTDADAPDVEDPLDPRDA